MNESLILESLTNEENITVSPDAGASLPVDSLSCEDAKGEDARENDTSESRYDVNTDDNTVENINKIDPETRRVAVSVHHDAQSVHHDSNSFSKSTVSSTLEILSSRKKSIERESDDANPATVARSTCNETQTSLGTSAIFYTETTILGASTTSLTSISSSTTVPYRPGPARHRRIGYIDENDLSTPYNHYRCLSPNEHYGKLFCKFLLSGFVTRLLELYKVQLIVCSIFFREKYGFSFLEKAVQFRSPG